MACSSSTVSTKKRKIDLATVYDDKDDNDESSTDKESYSSTSSSDSPKSTVRHSTEFPDCTSRWTEKTLTALSIKYVFDEETTPIDLIHMFPMEEGRSLSKFFMPRHIGALEIFFQSYCNFNFMLDKEFKDITRDEANHLRHRDRFDSTEFLKSLDPDEINIDVKDLQFWLRSFEACGIKFGEILYSMVNRREYLKAEKDKAENSLMFEYNTEYEFQILFDAFASMFGLKSYNWCEPIMPKKKLELSVAKVTGKADILYCQNISNPREQLFQSLNITAVCEVKKLFKQTIEEDERITRIDDVSSKLHNHIPFDLLGKHGGDLLLYYDQSVRKDGIFGFIVQGTKVSFTCLQMTNDQFQSIKSSQKVLPPPRLIITKPYDFMKKEDRKHLIRPLLELALCQEVKFK